MKNFLKKYIPITFSKTREITRATEGPWGIPSSPIGKCELELSVVAASEGEEKKRRRRRRRKEEKSYTKI